MTLLDENGDEKEYTYYSTSYVQEHKEEINLEDVCYISPVDISNYFLAFHEFPANFVTSGSYQEVFKEYTKMLKKETKVKIHIKYSKSGPIIINGSLLR